MPEAAILDRALGSYLGLAVGDALGATVEFMTAREIAGTYGVHKRILGGGWLHLKPGQVTDDTQMSLALGSAIEAADGWSLHGVAEAFAAWMRSRPPDIGNICRRGIRRFLLEGTLSSAPCEEDGGNGALMRNLPVVLAHLHDEEAMIDRSLEQAHITHWHSLGDAALVALSRMTSRLVLGGSIEECRAIADEFVAAYPKFRFSPWPGFTSGYVVDTVQTVLDAFFTTGDFESCLIKVVNRGGDADTTGAIAGQLAGALHGVRGIPVRWMRKLDARVSAAICEQTRALVGIARRVVA